MDVYTVAGLMEALSTTRPTLRVAIQTPDGLFEVETVTVVPVDLGGGETEAMLVITPVEEAL